MAGNNPLPIEPEDLLTIREADAPTIWDESPCADEQHATSAPARQGNVICGYKVIRELSTVGAEADIYVVDQDSVQRILKLYRRNIIPNEEVLRKVSDLAAKSQRHIVSLIDYGFDRQSQRWFELQEYLDLGSLRDIKLDASSEDVLKCFIGEINKGLKVLHESNILHLDLKPSNILIRSLEPPSVAFADFGVSSLLDIEVTRKITEVKGTPHYWAPESLTGIVGKEADYWSTGMILLEMFLGRHPFRGIDNKVIMYTLATKGVYIPEAVPQRLKKLLKGLLTREPQMRWGAAEVDRWLAGELDIPDYYHTDRAAQDEYSAPLQFNGVAYRSLGELAAAVSTKQELWEAFKEYLDKNYITSWLNENKDYENSLRIQKIANTSKDDPDLAVIRFIYTYRKDLPFLLYGRIISIRNIISICQQRLGGHPGQQETQIIYKLVSGMVSRYYGEYLFLTGNEPDLFHQAITLLDDKITADTYKRFHFHDDDADILTILRIFSALHDTAEFYIPKDIMANTEEHVRYIVDNDDYLFRKDFIADKSRAVYMPPALMRCISNGEFEGSGEDFLGWAHAMRTLLEDKEALTPAMFRSIVSSSIVPSPIKWHIESGSPTGSVRALQELAQLHGAGQLFNEEAVRKYFAMYSKPFGVVFAGGQFISHKTGKPLTVREYRSFSKYMANEVAPHYAVFVANTVEKLTQVSYLEISPWTRRAVQKLCDYLSALKDCRVKWTRQDMKILRELKTVFSSGTPVEEMVTLSAQEQSENLLSRVLGTSVPRHTHAFKWGAISALAGLLIGLSMFGLTVSSGVSSILIPLFFCLVLFLVRQSLVLSAPLVLLTMMIVPFERQLYETRMPGGEILMDFILLMALGVIVTGRIGVSMGKDREVRTDLDRIYNKHRARIDDVTIPVKGVDYNVNF